jgi:hypothetical protein
MKQWRCAMEETFKGYREGTGRHQRMQWRKHLRDTEKKQEAIKEREEIKEEELGRDEGIQENIQQCGFKIVRKQTLSR